MSTPARPGTWTGSDLLARLLRFGAAGSAVALVLAAREVALQGYVEIGWTYSAGRSLRDAVLSGAAIGAVGALALGAIRDNLVASLPDLDGVLSVEALRGPPLRRAWVSVCAGALATALLLGWRALDEGAITHAVWPLSLATALLVAAAIWLAGTVVHRRAGAWVWTALFGLVWSGFASGPYGRAELARGDWSGPGAALIAAALVFGCLAARPPREVGLARWLALPGLPLVAAALLALGTLALGPSLTPGRPRSVVLIAVDTLRMDRTSLAPGDARARTLTPALAVLGRQGAVFTEATSQAPWTLPAFASVVTGRYPAEHGAVSRQGQLARGELTLAEVLREAGYQTAGVVSQRYVDGRRGLAQGFDHFDDSNVLGDGPITGEGVTDAALAWLARKHEGPFFLFAHYFDPHYEYRDHDDWDFADPGRTSFDLSGMDLSELRTRLDSLTPDDVATLRDLYDEEVAYTDRAIGRLLAALPPDAAVILVGDHGEELLERDWLGHTISLHREVVRVPLVMRLPGVTQPGRRIAVPVETRGVHATVLDYLGLPGVARDESASLLPLLRGEPWAERVVFSQVWLPDQPESSGERVRRSLARRGSWLLLRDHDAGRDRLFSIDARRGRERPVGAPAERRALAAELDAWLRRMDAAGRTVLP